MQKTFQKLKKNPIYTLNLPLLATIKVYQVFLSFDHGLPHLLFPNTRVCRHFPSCSEYTYEAIENTGPIKGSFYGVKRIISCGPWTPANTFDPAPKA
jgi:uncharacterized protein